MMGRMCTERFSGRWTFTVMLGVVLLSAGCASRVSLAPVEDRRGSDPTVSGGWIPAPVVVQSPVVVAPSRVLPGAENAGKPGYFTVRPGDTVRQIGRETGVAWQDIVRWNNLENPNQIEIGQVLRVAPPSYSAGSGSYVTPTYTTPALVSGVNSRPLPPIVSSGVDTSRSSVLAPLPSVAPVSVGNSGPVVSGGGYSAPLASTASNSPPVVGGDDNIAWIWPNSGPVMMGFDPIKNKGLAIAGRAGDPVIAAADGVVVYAGSGLRGYGNLVILKHNNMYLTAYAHNQVLLVKEDQSVRKGQKIAEMGSSDSDRVKLHFEVRRNGTPVDPMRYLPLR